MIQGGNVILLTRLGIKMVKFGNLTREFNEGTQAYVDGVKVKNNPYKYGTPQWEDWKDGHGFCKAVALCLMRLKDGDSEPSSNGVNSNGGIRSG